MLNLVVNARDAMPEGGNLTIELNAQSSVSMVSLRVRDTGKGMDAQTLPRIFEPFFTTKGIGKGTGLGLSSVYGLVKRAGGEIQVHSEVGHGTAFVIVLPAIEPVPEKGVGMAQNRTARTRTILLVDDDAQVRGIARAFLVQAGYAVVDAQSGQQALALLSTESEGIALVVTDVRMPGMSGLELMRLVRQSGPQPPVLLVSGFFHAPAEIGESLPPGTAYLAKPYTYESLIEAVQAALGRDETVAVSAPAAFHG